MLLIMSFIELDDYCEFNPLDHSSTVDCVALD